jgi:hypothetical protein
MRAPSIKRRPTGRRPSAPTRWRRRGPRALVPPACALAALLVLFAVLGSNGGDAGPGVATAAAEDTGTATGTAPDGKRGRKAGNPYRGDGMWIWYVRRSSGGSVKRIARKAKRHGIKVLYIKSSDGATEWDQFTRGLVRKLHRRNLRVCAWQYVYGKRPAAEARRGAQAVRKGADCLVVDAEAEYEGHYRAADHFVDKLRRRIGRRFPTSLSSFPYVDYHPSLPYSVLLGPGGVKYNLPQVYWHAIGDGVGEADRHTIRYNRVYQRPIHPLGQTYRDERGRPSRKQIQRFRRLAISFGFKGISWWSWQHTSRKQWRVLRRNVEKGISGARRGRKNYPLLGRGSKGDLVVWAQEHLRGAGARLPVTGFFGRKTRRAVKRFQRKRGLQVDGKIGPQTWRKLLKVKPDTVDWSSKGRKPGERSAGAAEPRSASLPAVRYEIPTTVGP